jgi:hypothetical protein
MKFYRAKVLWREGSVVCTTNVTVSHETPAGGFDPKWKADVDSKFWKKFRDAYPDALSAAIVARWEFDPPPVFFKPSKSVTAREERGYSFACHAWPILLVFPGRADADRLGLAGSGFLRGKPHSRRAVGADEYRMPQLPRRESAKDADKA